MDPKLLVKTSKRLSLVLRHKPESVGVKLDAAGWTDVDGLLRAMRISREDLNKVVADNNKKRFEFSGDGKRIRASQGHSVDVDLGYEPSDPPDVLYHGTYANALDSIFKTGLDKRDRHHVHMSKDVATAQQVGQRRGDVRILLVNAAAMVRDGFKFYVSTNGVWLTDHVPAKYLSVRSETYP